MDPSMGGGSGGEEAAIFAGVMLLVIIVSAIIGFAISVLFTWLMWDSYKVVPQQFQKIPAGLVWLCLIPCLGGLLMMVLSILIPLSFKDAFAARGRSDFGDCGMLLGILWIVGSVLGIIPFIGALFVLAGFVCMIIFLVKLRQMKAAILAG
jgi:hypothetical protein